MEVARTSMIHAAAPHFLWPFAVRYAAHQLNLLPRVSLPETSPTLRVSQVDPLPVAEPVKVTVDSGAARAAASGGAEPTSAEPGGADPEGEELGGAESEGVESGGAEPLRIMRGMNELGSR
ncbi:unnamed protein product [Closterium sp. NIES-53]